METSESESNRARFFAVNKQKTSYKLNAASASMQDYAVCLHGFIKESVRWLCVSCLGPLFVGADCRGSLYELNSQIFWVGILSAFPCAGIGRVWTSKKSGLTRPAGCRLPPVAGYARLYAYDTFFRYDEPSFLCRCTDHPSLFFPSLHWEVFGAIRVSNATPWRGLSSCRRASCLSGR